LPEKDFPARDRAAYASGQTLYIFPNGIMMDATITTPESLGTLIRRRRRELGLTQTELAGVAATTLRFVSELERGKSTAQLDGVLRILAALGLKLTATAR
jgi:HTH-type transcriptional regulator / antitoxin HipB